MSVRPTLHTSDLTVYDAPWIRSGAMYVPVPTNVSATEPSSSEDTPKSHSLICPRWFMRTFEGLISRCMMRWFCHKYVRPPKTDSAILPKTSTRTGPKFLETESRELVNLSDVSQGGGNRMIYPQSMYSITIMTSPASFMNAPKKETMFGELHSCMICNSRTIRLRTSDFASTWIICNQVSVWVLRASSY
jgi:hypothetical protein